MKKVLAALLATILLAGLTAQASAQKKQEARPKDRLKRLQSTIKKMDLRVRDMTDAELDLAIQKHEQMLAKYAGNEFTPTVLYQLSELYIQKARKAFEKQMEEYEKAYDRYLQKELAEEPVLPRVDFREAKIFLQEILDDYPDVGFKDKVLYRLALCYQEEGNTEESIRYFERLIREVPHSNLVPEAYFRLGEHYFDKGDNEQALRYYEKLVTPEMWSNPFFDMSLYKMGWAYYRLNRYPEAISTFMYLLKDIDALERVQTQQIDRTAADLRKEASTYVAISFAEYGNPEEAFEFLETFSDPVYQKYKKDILAQLGEIYLRQDRYDEAIATFRYLLNHFPLDPEAPTYAQRIVLAHEKKWDIAGANEARGQLITSFGPNSRWYAAQKDSLLKVNTLRVVKEALYKKGVYHQLQGREQKNNVQYEKAVQQYRNFLALFPDDSLAYKVTFYLGECLYELGRYKEAATYYTQVFRKYGDTDYAEQAAYNAILSYYQASQQNASSGAVRFTIHNFYGLIGDVSLEVPDSSLQHFILASNEFVERFPDNPHVVEVLMKEAEVLNDLGRYDLSRRVYLMVVRNYPNSPFFATAVTMIAQAYFNEEDYSQAEAWYATITKTLPDSLPVVGKARLMMASSHFKLAEKYRRSGKLERAAEEFAATALKYPDSEVAESALIEAAKTYELLGNKAKAAAVFEEFLRRYPENRLFELCALRAARYREAIEQWEKAATNYALLRNKKAKNRVLALFLAGQNYFKAKKWNEAIEAFQAYLVEADNLNRALEAQTKIGLAWYEQDEVEKAKNAFRRAVDIYQQAPDRSKLNSYYVAQAQFMLGEIAYLAFSAIQLDPPFKTNLKRKSDALKTTLKAYTAAAKYRVAEWTTAASYKIGIIFEEFANAILTSPIPGGLSDEEIRAYEDQLKELALPFQQKALEAYQSNVRRAEKNGIVNRWVTLSKSRLSMLSSVLKGSE